MSTVPKITALMLLASLLLIGCNSTEPVADNGLSASNPTLAALKDVTKAEEALHSTFSKPYHTATGKSEKIKKSTREQVKIIYWIGKTEAVATVVQL